MKFDPEYTDKKPLISLTPRPYYHYREIEEHTLQSRYFAVISSYTVTIMERDRDFIQLKVYTSEDDLRKKADLICKLLNTLPANT